ncbi:insulinase family protein [Reinekea thalattae]|uniref:Protease 3 n=1 Tax=Reinekea thalattae TaxID=2593301 RepID=A0A5C8ZB31_9GAMM|nr:insulinase family protein [Reinekea thalattae]TXR54096.1 hypothetical protein FME95_06040 [Reinekea thalattae]
MKLGKTIAILTGVIVIVAVAGLLAVKLTKFTSKNASNIEVSDQETRTFKSLTLNNGLKVILVSDSESDKAAAALNVFSGSWANPADIPGLAHFLEHMLFLGTEKYPVVDDYTNFIQTNGGSSNAYTAAENTLFYFDINADKYQESLDRFSQFFIAPLFDSDFTQREINAVHSEYAASLQDDSRRIGDVVREITSPNHPASRLAVGTLDTLDVDNLETQLRSFFQEHYVASNMSLSIYGPQDIETLEQWATNYFGGIRNADSGNNQYPQMQFDSIDLPKLVEIEPRRDVRQLQMRFPITASTANLSSKPAQYVASLIGQRSSGSLLSELKNLGWADSLYVNDGGLTHSSTSFDISIALTPQGMAHWEDVVQLTFSEIELIRQQGIDKRFYQEQQQINDIAFQFAEQTSAQRTARMLAERLQYLDAEFLLSWPYRLPKFNGDQVEAVLAQLKPDNALILLAYPEAETDQRSEYYNTPYRQQLLTGNQVAAWRNAALDSRLSLPEPNPFIPEDLTVQPLEQLPSQLYKNIPHIITADSHTTTWFEQDDEFLTPKIDLHILLQGDFTNRNAKNIVATNLYLQLVSNALEEVRYHAGKAGSGYGIQLSEDGVQLRLYGYSDKLGLLADALVFELVEHQINPNRFDIEKDNYLRALKNRAQDSVINQSVRTLNQWLISTEVETESLIDELEKITIEDLISTRQQLFANAHLTMLLHGNLTNAEATRISQRIDAVIPQQGSKPESRSIAHIAQKRFLTKVNFDHPDSALLQYFQGENSSLRERALYMLLAKAINAPYYSELRTREQLGYIVTAQSYTIDGFPGLIFYVQSPHTDAALLQLYSDRFLNRYNQSLLDMTEAQFNDYKIGLSTTLLEEDKNLYQLSSRYWQNIVDGNKNFNTQIRLAQEINKISLDGFRRFYANEIVGDLIRSVSLHQVGKSMARDYADHSSSLISFHSLTKPKQWPSDVDWIIPSFNNVEQRP